MPSTGGQLKFWNGVPPTFFALNDHRNQIDLFVCLFFSHSASNRAGFKEITIEITGQIRLFPKLEKRTVSISFFLRAFRFVFLGPTVLDDKSSVISRRTQEQSSPFVEATRLGRLGRCRHIRHQQRPHIESGTRISLLHALADIFAEGDKQLLSIYLFKSVDGRHFKVKLVSVHVADQYFRAPVNSHIAF